MADDRFLFQHDQMQHIEIIEHDVANRPIKRLATLGNLAPCTSCALSEVNNKKNSKIDHHPRLCWPCCRSPSATNWGASSTHNCDFSSPLVGMLRSFASAVRPRLL